MRTNSGAALAYCGVACLALAVAATAGAPPAIPIETAGAPTANDTSAPSGFLRVGKWMYDAVGEPARWLGEVYRGKQLREPINVLIVDEFATSAAGAKARLLAACQQAGYPARFGHSSGYRGYIDGSFYPQLPEQKDHAFSNFPFEVDNNHGRVFGPAYVAGAAGGPYYFIGAFSRERVDPVTKVKHRYGSFDRARDDFAQRMDEYTVYKVTAFVSLENALTGDPGTTTGDHDGIAVLLTATR